MVGHPRFGWRGQQSQCETCAFLDSGPVYDKHISDKNRAQEENEKDKLHANHDKSFHSATFDLQSVLQIPCS